jgi:hypothetical protein
MTGSSRRCDREGTGTASLIGGRVTQLKRGERQRKNMSGHRRQPDPDLCWNCGERGAALGLVGSLRTCPECEVTWVPGWSAARGDPDYVCWMGKAVLCVDFTKPESLGAPALRRRSWPKDTVAPHAGGGHPDEVRGHPLDPRLKPGADERRALGLGIQVMRCSPHQHDPPQARL